MEKDRAVACPQRRGDLSKVVSIKVKMLFLGISNKFLRQQNLSNPLELC